MKIKKKMQEKNNSCHNTERISAFMRKMLFFCAMFMHTLMKPFGNLMKLSNLSYQKDK